MEVWDRVWGVEDRLGQVANAVCERCGSLCGQTRRNGIHIMYDYYSLYWHYWYWYTGTVVLVRRKSVIE